MIKNNLVLKGGGNNKQGLTPSYWKLWKTSAINRVSQSNDIDNDEIVEIINSIFNFDTSTFIKGSGKYIHQYTGNLSYTISINTTSGVITRVNTTTLNNQYSSLTPPLTPYSYSSRNGCSYQGATIMVPTYPVTCSPDYHSYWVNLYIGEIDYTTTPPTLNQKMKKAWDESDTITYSGFQSGKTYLIAALSSYHDQVAMNEDSTTKNASGLSARMPGWEPYVNSNVLLVKWL